MLLFYKALSKKIKTFKKTIHHFGVAKIFAFLGLCILMLTLPLLVIVSERTQITKQNAASNISPLIFGTNLTLIDATDQFITSQATRDAMKSIHVQIIRIPIRNAGGAAPQEVTAMQYTKAMGAVPLIILKYTQTDPTGAAKLVIQQANTVFGNSIVYYEFGNERDLAGVNQTQYAAQWNQTIPQVKSLPINGKFGGPTNYHTDPGYISYFVHSANPKPDFISWHEYTCSSSDAAQTCINNIGNWKTHITSTKSAITGNHDTVPPIFITEWNYDPVNPSPDSRVTAQFEQQFTQKALQELANDGVTGATHYVATGHTEYNLIDPSGHLTAEGQMFGQMYTQLIGTGGGTSPTPTAGNSPTPQPTPTSGSTPTPTPPCDTGTPSPPFSTDTPTPLPTDTGIPTPSQIPNTPTPTPGPPVGSLTVHFEAIDGENNPTPKHPQRNIILSFFKSNNFSAMPAATLNTIVTFVSGDTNGSFVNPNIDLSSISSGLYYVLAKSPEGSLNELLNNAQQVTIGPGVITTFSSQTNNQTAKPVTLRMGDLNNDNVINVKDYNTLVDCYSSKANSPSCKKHAISDITKGLFADVNDDGVVNGIDYNILIRHLGENGYGSVVSTNISTAFRASPFIPCQTPSPSISITNAATNTPIFTSNHPILAFYYMWYDTSSWSISKMSDLPAASYNSSDDATIDRQITQAANAGITGFVSSWWGMNDKTDTNFAKLLTRSAAYANTTGHHVTSAVYIENTSTKLNGIPNMVSALQYVMSHYANDPHYFHWQNKPVIFFTFPIAGNGRTLADWTTIRRQVDPNNQAVWSAEGVDVNVLDIFDGMHLFSAGYWGILNNTMPAVDQGFRSKVDAYNSSHHTNKIWAAGVLPGYDDTRLGRPNSYVVPRNNGTTYKTSWAAAIASKPEWITITTFNEWYEGAMIEPSAHYGNQYLDLTLQLAKQWH